MIEFAAITAALVLSFLTIFQLLLIIGLPLGKFAWGGQHTVIPLKLRVTSVLSIGLYVLFALIILNQSGVIEIWGNNGWANTALTIITGYSFIGILMNALSRSKSEKLVMTPVATVIALSFLYVALNT